MKNACLPVVLLLALLLSACDNAKEPAEAPTVAAPVPVPVPSPVEPVAPEPVKPQPSEPEPAPEAQRLPPVSITVAPAKHPPAKTLKLPELDLSLPDELLETVELGEPLPKTTLLPSLFGQQHESDFRLNGRLISSDDEDKMFEGAELSFEFKN